MRAILTAPLTNKKQIKMNRIKICKGYKKGKYDSICVNCNSNKSFCDYTRTLK